MPELEVHGVRNGDARALLSSAVRFKLDERSPRPDHRRDAGESAGVAGAAAGVDGDAVGGRLRPAGRAGAAQDGSRRASSDDSRRSQTTRGVCCWSRQRSRSAIRGCCGGRPSGSGSGWRPRIADETDGLLMIGERVTFRHPLVRSAVYRSAARQERRAVHLALAEATDGQADPDRRAWHLAAAAPGPDEQIASELERSAYRAQARGGLAAAAAFLQRAVALTKDPARRTERALAAAQASLQAGAFDAALGLVARAEAGLLDETQRARADLLRGRVAFASGLGRRCSPAAVQGRAAARAARPRARARDLPDGLGRGGLRRARGRRPGDLPRHPGPPGVAGSSTSPRPAARRPRPADHRRTRRCDSDFAASSASARRHPRGGRPEVGLEGHGRQRRRVGRRAQPRDRRATGPARARRRRACGAADPPLRVGLASAWIGDFAGAAVARRRGRQRRGGDRQPHCALHRAEARGRCGAGKSSPPR